MSGKLILHHPTLPDNIEKFLAGQLSDNTRKAYLKDILQFLEFKKIHSTEELKNLSFVDAVEYRNFLFAVRKLSPASINRKLSALRAFFAFLEELGITERNPFSSKLVKGFKRPAMKAPNVLSAEQMRKLISVCELDQSPAGIRDKAILLLGLVEWLRASEVLSLKKKNLTKKGEVPVLILEKTKSGTEQIVVLRKDVLKAIEDYLFVVEAVRPLREDERIFLSFSNRNFLKPLTGKTLNLILKKRLEQAGIPPKGFSFHSLRHSGITNALENKAPLHLVQWHARHADPKTTMSYARAKEWLRENAVYYIKF